MSSVSPRHFYVYVLSRPNGSPFYIGKGTSRRMYVHVTEARKGHKCHKCHVIRKILREGQEIHVQKVFETPDEAAAFAYERTLIATIGRDLLTNDTDGGDGASGSTGSELSRRVTSERNRRVYEDPAAREAFAQRSRVYRARPEIKAKYSVASKAYRARPEIKAKYSTRMRELNADPAFRAKSQAVWSDPAHRLAHAERQAIKNKTEAMRQHASEAMRLRHKNPEFIAKLRAGQAAGRLRRKAK